MPSLSTIYSILFVDFKESKKQRKFDILLGSKSKDHETKSNLAKFLKDYGALAELGKYLFGPSFTDTEHRKALEQEQKAHFHSQNQQFKYFDSSNRDLISLYLNCYRFCRYQDQFVEYNNVTETPQRAYKMMLFFGPPIDVNVEYSQDLMITTIKNMEEFIRKHLHGSSTPVHDLFMHDFPINNPDNKHFNFLAWKEKIHEILGYKALKNFADAPKISKYIVENYPAMHAYAHSDNIPNSQNDFEKILVKCAYDRIEENPALGKLYKFYNVPEESFNRALELIHKGILRVDETGHTFAPKLYDYILDISVPISDGKYYLVKLPPHDPRSTILGHITNCCQSLGGYAEQCVIDGMNLSNNGFYVFVKAGPNFDPNNIDWNNFESKDGDRTGNVIIGQSYVWLGLDNSFTIDSLEIVSSFAKELDLKTTLEKLGNALHEANPHIVRMMIGTDGKTEEVLRANNYQLLQSTAPSLQKEGNSNYDSNNQFEAYVHESLKDARKSLKLITSQEQDHIVSLDQANLVIGLNQDYLPLLGSHYHYRQWTSLNITKNCSTPEDLLAIHKYLGHLQITKPNHYDIIFNRYYQINELLNFEDIMYVSNRSAKDDDSQFNAIMSEGSQILYNLGIKCKELLGQDSIETKRNILRQLAQKICGETHDSLEYIDTLEAELVNALNMQVKLYKEFGVKVVDLKDLTPDVIELLGSMDSIEAYNTGHVVLSDLKELSSEKIKALTSKQVVEAYKTGKLTLYDLKDLDIEKIKTLTSERMITVYDTGYISFDDLKELDIVKITILTSEVAIKFYKRKICTISELKNFNTEFIAAISDYYNYNQVIKLCNSGYASLSDLIDCTKEQIKFLSSDISILLYETNQMTITNLKELLETESPLISNNARWLYKEVICSFTELQELPASKVKLLISDDAISIYSNSNKKVTFKDLKALTTERIELLISNQARYLYQNSNIPFGDITSISNELLENILGMVGEFLQVFNDGYVKISDLESCSRDQIKILISKDAYEAYKTGKVTLLDLIGLDVKKMKNLTYYPAISAYNKGMVTLSDLKNLDNEQIEVLTSGVVHLAYDLGYRVSDLFGTTKEIIHCNILKSLFQTSNETSVFIENLNYEAINRLIAIIYKIYYFPANLPHLKDFSLNTAEDIDKLELLLSENATSLYRSCNITMSDLKNASCEKIKILLASEDYVSDVCKAGYIKFSDLLAFTVKYMKVLISYQAYDLYKTGKVTIDELKSCTIEMIECLTTWSARSCFATGMIKVSDFTEMSTEQVRELTSDNAAECYRLGCNVKDLASSGSDNIKHKILKQFAVKLCKESENSLSYIDNLNTDLVRQLLEYFPIEAYKTGTVTVTDLKDFSAKKIELLTSPSAIWGYTTCAITISDLKDLSNNQIEYLISQLSLIRLSRGFTIIDSENLSTEEMESFYKSGILTIQEFLDFTPEQIRALTLSNAIRAYKYGVVTISELKPLDPKIVFSLISNYALKCYELGCTLQDLIADTKEMIQCNILKNLAYKVCGEPHSSLSYINSLDTELVNVLIDSIFVTCDSGEVSINTLKDFSLEYIKTVNFYFSNYTDCQKQHNNKFIPATFENLKNLTSEELVSLMNNGNSWGHPLNEVGKIEKIINCRGLDKETKEELYSYQAKEAYSKGYLRAAEIKHCSLEQIKALTNYNAVNAYKGGLVTPLELITFPSNIIKKLTGYEFLRHYEHYKIRASDFIGCSIEQINALTSYYALQAYRDGSCKVEDLKCFTPEQIDSYLSHQSLEAIKTGYVTLKDISMFSKDQINILTSENLLDAYKTGQVKITDFIDLDPEKIILLSSCLAIMAYKTGKASILELKNYEIEQIQVLISNDAIECYQIGFNVANIVANNIDERKSSSEIEEKTLISLNLLQMQSSTPTILVREDIDTNLIGDDML